MHVVFLFPRKKSVHNFVCGVCVGCRVYCYQPSFLDRPYLHIASIDVWSVHDFLANATVSPYLIEIALSSVDLFISGILMSSVIQSVIYCS